MGQAAQSEPIDELAHPATGAELALRSAGWAAYAACIWAALFATVSFYWAAGGTAGGETIGPAITSMARDPAFVAVLWGTGALKLAGALLALALAQPRNRNLPRRPLLAAAWSGGILMALYGGASWMQEGLMVAGVLPIPAGLGRTAAWWHVLLWDPWWLVGGIIFMSAAWDYGRRTSSPGRGTV